MTDQGKANYEAYRAKAGGVSMVSGAVLPGYDEMPAAIRDAWDAGADAVEQWLAEAPVDEDAPGNEPIGAAGIDRLVKLAEGFEARHREYAAAARQNAHDQDFARAQIAIGASYRKCAEQLRDVIGDLGSPTAEDYDRAADEPDVRYALVEQMGHRATYAAIRETTFLGEPVLEVTALNDGSVHLVSPKSIFEVTLMPEDQARNLAARTTSWTAVALPAADPWRGDDEDDDGERDTARRMDALDEAARLEARPVTAETPGQADAIPAAFGGWVRMQFPPEIELPKNEIAGHWKHMTGPAEREFWRDVDAALAAQQPQPAPGDVGYLSSDALAKRYGEALQRIVDAGPSDAVDKLARNALGLTRVPRPKKPQPAPELAAAMAESRRYRDALQQIASYAAGTATKQMIGTTARRALDGKS